MGTQAHTPGEPSHLLSWSQVATISQVQMPPQSAPPWLGSQLSVGSSTQVPEPGHPRPVIPPQVMRSSSGTHLATGGQGARTQVTGTFSQWVPATHRVTAH